MNNLNKNLYLKCFIFFLSYSTNTSHAKCAGEVLFDYATDRYYCVDELDNNLKETFNPYESSSSADSSNEENHLSDSL